MLSRRAVKAGLVAISNGEERRQIKGGGLRANNEAVTNERATYVWVEADFAMDGRRQTARSARRNTVLLKPASARACIPGA